MDFASTKFVLVSVECRRHHQCKKVLLHSICYEITYSLFALTLFAYTAGAMQARAFLSMQSETSFTYQY